MHVYRVIEAIHEVKATPRFTYSRLGGLSAQPISEYVLANIVAHERNFKMVYEAEAKSSWLAIAIYLPPF